MKTRNQSKFNLVKSTLVAAAILVGALASAPAMAQSGSGGGTGKVSVHDISIVSLKPANQDLGYKAETVEMALLLPAVQKVREAAAWVHLEGEGWELDVPVYGRAEGTKMAKIVFWTSEVIAPNGVQKVLNVQNQAGQIKQLTIPSIEVAISILLPVGRPKGIIADSTRHNTVNEIVLADGSVRPVYMALLLPAIQKIRW